ncbi:hypothetical protein LCGC14_1359610 [marine sediment metagenome]|uniref:Uncharacterized protein n=1 Tax=marine sediment metagenome TaxID=412755 RepID=A0A0F9K8J1_9ZZZZ
MGVTAILPLFSTMTSIQYQISRTVKKTPGIELRDLKPLFPDINPNTLRSCYNRALNDAPRRTTVASLDNATKINMENAEELIIEQLKQNPSVPVLRLMVDFLKIKQMDHSELEEIDLELFYKKAMEE